MLKGKIALISGASKGIGRNIALCFAQNGADIVMLASHDSPYAQETCKQVESLGVKCLFMPCDVSNSELVDSCVKTAIEKFSKIDILVNNAGITADSLLMNMSENDFDRVIDINLKGTFLLTQACIRGMMKRKYGKIINISSVVGLMGNPGQSNYAASKAGIIGFSKSIAREYASRNITCNAIAPGFIQTDMTDHMSENAKTNTIAQIPMKKIGQTQDVANLALFLASDMSQYITGQTINVDGGLYI